MGGARNNFKGGEEIGGKEERNGGASRRSYRCEVFLFFFREEKFRLGKALSLLVALSSLSLFFKFFLRIRREETRRIRKSNMLNFNFYIFLRISANLAM